MRTLIAIAAAGLGLVTLSSASPARAEFNRLLPFWGQPYPSGYAYAVRPDAERPGEVRPVRHRPRPAPACRCRMAPHGRR